MEKIMTHKLSDSLLAVEVPEGAFSIDYVTIGTYRNINYSHANGHGSVGFQADGKHELIGLYPSEITEEMAKGLVGKVPLEIAPSPSNDWGGDYSYEYIDYENLGEYAGYQGDAGYYTKALKSLASLIASKGLQNKNLCLIKIIK